MCSTTLSDTAVYMKSLSEFAAGLQPPLAPDARQVIANGLEAVATDVTRNLEGEVFELEQVERQSTETLLSTIGQLVAICRSERRPPSDAAGLAGLSPSPRPARKAAKVSTPDKQREDLVRTNIVSRNGEGATRTRFTDVIGQDSAKQTLKEALLFPVKYPHLFANGAGPKPWRCVLMYGPPGTGKSKLSEALSNEIESNFLKISSSDLVSRWVGESEKMIRSLFTQAADLCQSSSKSVVIFMDEIDSLCRARCSTEEEGTRRVKTELLIRISEMWDSPLSQKVFLLGATNCPWDLDPAFLRRFQKRVFVGLPTEADRLAMLMKSKESCDLSEREWARLATMTDGLTGSDITCLTQEVLYAPLRELTTCKHWEYERLLDMYFPATADSLDVVQASFEEVSCNVEPRKVQFRDFEQGLRSITRTVTQGSLDLFAKFGAMS